MAVVVVATSLMGLGSSPWAELGLCEGMARAPARLGWVAPTAIQRACVPVILRGRDVVGQAETGSGKSGAYALPLLQRATAAVEPGVVAIVITPTRELCVQVTGVIKELAAEGAPGVRVGCVYGGTSRTAEAASLREPPHVLVATPGRLLDHLAAGHLDASALPIAVLDEADRLLELGFYEEVAEVLDRCAPEQRVLFSATMPSAVLQLVEEEMDSPERVQLGADQDAGTLPESLELVGVRAALGTPRGPDAREGPGPQRLEAVGALLTRLCSAADGASGLVFCNTRASAQQTWSHLRAHPAGLVVALLSGELEQRSREQALLLLRQRAVHALVATDLGARGLDVDGLDFVLNAELPPVWDGVAFVHRAGRAGRAGSPGLCLSLCGAADEERALQTWAAAAGRDIQWQEPPALADRPVALPPPEWSVLHVSGGKRDKLSRGDVLGALTALTPLRGEDVGRIEIFARDAYVGVPREAARAACEALRAGKIKKQRRAVHVVDPAKEPPLRRQTRRPPSSSAWGATGGQAAQPRPAKREPSASAARSTRQGQGPRQGPRQPRGWDAAPTAGTGPRSPRQR